MRRYWLVALAVLTLLGVLSPPVWAQAPAAPAPKVTINGVVDNMVNYNRNLSLGVDVSRGGITNPGDVETYGRTRGRFDITGELGKARAVLGLEIDLSYGQTGGTDNADTGATQRFGLSGGFDANTDVRSVIEIKWMYVDLPFSGPGSLLPFIPWAGTMTLGGQPYALGLRPSIFADSDFGGGTVRMTVSPTFNFSLTYAQLEEAASGVQDNAAAATGFFGRGDDFGIIFKANWQATKELSVSPIYAYQELQGTTNSNVRQAVGGYGNGATAFAPDGAATLAGGIASGTANSVITPCLGTPAANVLCRSTEEVRHFIGVDARWASGPWYVAPTAFYQLGSREKFQAATDPGANAAALKRKTANISAWIVDVETGYRVGPVLVQVRGMYTSGNKASDNLDREVGYYQPFQTDTTYWTGWGGVVPLENIEYFNSLYANATANGLNMGNHIGYDRFGRAQFSVKGTYDWTPALSIYGIVSPAWTAREVPKNAFLAGNGGLAGGIGGITCNSENPTGLGALATTNAPCTRRDAGGGSSFLGTDMGFGFTWRFAPGLTFDWIYALLVPGSAYDVNRFASTDGAGAGVPGTVSKFNADNVYSTTARVRYSF